MKKIQLFIQIFSLLILTVNCKKVPIEPSGCNFTISLKYIDINTGEDLDLANNPFLSSIKITDKVFFGEELIEYYDSLDIEILNVDNNTQFRLYSSDLYNICNDKTFNLNVNQRFTINYIDGINSDSIDIKFNKINNFYVLSYFLNDSIIENLSYNKIINKHFDFPTIIIKK